MGLSCGPPALEWREDIAGESGKFKAPFSYFGFHHVEGRGEGKLYVLVFKVGFGSEREKPAAETEQKAKVSLTPQQTIRIRGRISSKKKTLG